MVSCLKRGWFLFSLSIFYISKKRATLKDGSKKEIGVYGDSVKECLASYKEEEQRLNKGIVLPNKERPDSAMNFWLENYTVNSDSITV